MGQLVAQQDGVYILKVATTSDPGKVAGALSHGIRQKKPMRLVAMGSDSCYIALKSIIIAQEFLKEEGYILSFSPAFVTLHIDAVEKYAIQIDVKKEN